MDQIFRELQEASCEALSSLHEKRTIQAIGAIEGSSDSANVTEKQLPLDFLSFPVFFDFPGFYRAQSDSKPTVHIVLQFVH